MITLHLATWGFEHGHCAQDPRARRVGGGEKLPDFVPPPEAFGKMITTIDGLTIKHSGRFMERRARIIPGRDDA
jgi:hypothetical protein